MRSAERAQNALLGTDIVDAQSDLRGMQMTLVASPMSPRKVYLENKTLPESPRTSPGHREGLVIGSPRGISCVLIFLDEGKKEFPRALLEPGMG